MYFSISKEMNSMASRGKVISITVDIENGASPSNKQKILRISILSKFLTVRWVLVHSSESMSKFFTENNAESQLASTLLVIGNSSPRCESYFLEFD